MMRPRSSCRFAYYGRRWKKKRPRIPTTEEETLSRIIEIMSEAESLEAPFLHGDWPEWVKSVAKEFTRTMFPTHKLHGEFSAGVVGSLVGQKLAFLKYYEEGGIDDLAKLLPKIANQPASDSKRNFDRETADGDDEYMGAVRSVILALYLPHHSAKRFFAAFAKALAKKTVDLRASNFLRDTTVIYFFLLIFWKEIEKLTSIRELHTVLGRSLGEHLVGDLKRVEKLCQRIGLKLGRPGRPPKEKIQT